MTRTRRFLAATAAALAILLVLLIAVPFFFRGTIEARLKTALSGAVDARVDWSGASLNLLSAFPNVSLRVGKPVVVGVKRFERDTLLVMQSARLALDLGSVIRAITGGARVVVREVSLDRPDVRLRVLDDGTANWNITRPTESTASGGGSVGITLKGVRIDGGRVTLDDAQSHLALALLGLNESLSGDFAREQFTLRTRTTIDSASIRFAGVPYLSHASVELNADIGANTREQRFTLANDTLRLNKLSLAFSGAITTGKPDLGLDLTFNAPSTQFRDILSLVPVIYAHDFEQIQTTGTMAVSGRVRGAYGKTSFPAFNLDARVEDGTFRYPSLPLPARGIAMRLSARNPGGHVDSTIVDVQRLHAEIGGRPFEGRLALRTPVADPDVDLQVKGSVDLADLARTIKLEGVNELAGVVTADLATHARTSDVNAKRYERVDARGTLNVARLVLKSASIPHPIAVDTAALRFTPRNAELSTFSAKIGNSDVRANGALDNVIGFALGRGDLRGTATVSSHTFDLNDWRSKEKSTDVVLVPPRIDFTMMASVDKLLYGAITATNVHGGVRVKDQRVTLSDMNLQMLHGTVVANGSYETTVATRPTFDFAARVATLDIPTAFTSLLTVRALAPIAQWARGNLSGMVGLKGPLDTAMVPIFSALSGQGALETENVSLQDAPILTRMADALKFQQLRNPALQSARVSYDVSNGRVTVRPFTFKIAGLDMTVGGSHGIDQTLKYDVSVGKVATQITGTITKPTVNVAGTIAALKEAAQTAVQQKVDSGVDVAKAKADSAADEAKRRARAEAARLIAEAEKQADSLRAQAKSLADKIRQEASLRGDSLLAKATNPIAKRAAQVVVDRLKKEADSQADRIVREADAKATALVSQARQRVPPG